RHRRPGPRVPTAAGRLADRPAGRRAAGTHLRGRRTGRTRDGRRSVQAERGGQLAGARGWVRRACPRAHAHGRRRADRPGRAGLAVARPLRRATAVIESIAALDDYVSIQLYGHPWVSGEYWPMIAHCFQVRAVDDTGAEHEGVRGGGGGAPESSFEFSFWPPVAPGATRIRVIVSTLWEAAW